MNFHGIVIFPQGGGSTDRFDFPRLSKVAGPAIERSNQTAATEHQAGGDDGFLGRSFLEDHPTKQVVSHNLLTIVTTVTTC